MAVLGLAAINSLQAIAHRLPPLVKYYTWCDHH